MRLTHATAAGTRAAALLLPAFLAPLVSLASLPARAEDELSRAVRKAQQDAQAGAAQAPQGSADLGELIRAARKPEQAQPAGWILTYGLQNRHTSFSQSANPYDQRSWAGMLTALRQFGGGWIAGGTLIYDYGRLHSNPDDGRASTRTPSVNAIALKTFGGGYIADASLGYGKAALDNAYSGGGARISYSANTEFTSASAGLTKVFILSPAAQVSLSARYTYVDSRGSGYADSTGAVRTGTASSLGFATFGAGLKARWGRWEPYARAGWNLANKEFTAGTGDKAYFTYSLGVETPITQKTRVNLGYSGTAGWAYTRSDTVMVSFTTAF